MVGLRGFAGEARSSSAQSNVTLLNGMAQIALYNQFANDRPSPALTLQAGKSSQAADRPKRSNASVQTNRAVAIVAIGARMAEVSVSLGRLTRAMFHS